MAITNYLVHFKTQATYASTVASNPLRNDAVAFIKDATIIHTHGTDYYCGKSEVALKTDLAGKANLNHTHSADDITSGTLDISRIPTGTSSTTVALGDHTHATKHIGSLSGYIAGNSFETLNGTMSLNEALSSLQKQIQMRATETTLEDYALKTELAGYLPLTGGILSGTLTVSNISNVENLYGLDNFTIYGGLTGAGTLTFTGGQKSVVLSQSGFTCDGYEILTEDN